MKVILFTFLISLNATVGLTADSPLFVFIEKPTEDNLNAFRNDCLKQKAVKRDGFSIYLQKLLKKEDPTALEVRALIFTADHCSDGALAIDLSGYLGTQVLTHDSALLLKSLSQEKASEKLVRTLGSSDGQSGAGAFVDCDQRCLPKIDAFYDNKIAILSKLKPIGVELKDRNILIASAHKTKGEWHNRFK